VMSRLLFKFSENEMEKLDRCAEVCVINTLCCCRAVISHFISLIYDMRNH
jgi:hypothetical protein